ncbi:MAG: hypothetical protein AB7H80_17910, partial [Candidatus Kapaibacterium sp.]
LKEVVILYEHISKLLQEPVDENENSLRDMQGKLSGLLDDFVQSTKRSPGGGASNIKRDDLRDLGMMLQHRSLGDNSLIATLVKLLRQVLSLPRFRKLKFSKK